MTSRSVILIGGPDSGKTNYVARLWPSFRERRGTLRAQKLPNDIVYVDGAVEHLMQGKFAPRSDRNLEKGRQDFSIQVRGADGTGHLTNLVVPDISGELWLNAVRSHELSEDWLNAMKTAEGAILFVRVQSEANVQPMDWVTARKLMKLHAEDDLVEAEEAHKEGDLASAGSSATAELDIAVPETPELPMQVVLCELLRYLDLFLSNRHDGKPPRVAVVVAAWDLVDPGMRTGGPMAYLKREFPLFAGRLSDPRRLDLQLFGLSIVGGDLEDDEDFKQKFFEKNLVDRGWVVVREGAEWRQDPDVTLPIAWAVGD